MDAKLKATIRWQAGWLKYAQAAQMVEYGVAVARACRDTGITRSNFYRYRKLHAAALPGEAAGKPETAKEDPDA